MIRLALALLTLVLLSDAAAAKLPCLTKSQAMARGDSPSYRKVPGLGRCWYVGERTPKKSEFVPVKMSSSGGKTVRQSHGRMTDQNAAVRLEPQARGPLETNAGESVNAVHGGQVLPADSASRRGGPAPANELTPLRSRPPQSQGESRPEDDKHRGQPHHEGSGTKPAPEQARLDRAFNELRTLWATMHMAPWQVRAIYERTRMEYPREFPAVWAMASRWP